MERIYFQGEQFRVQMLLKTNGYNDCDQIVISVYNMQNLNEKILFVKVQDNINYPTAKIIGQDDPNPDLINIYFSKEMTSKMLGFYKMESKKVLPGNTSPIYITDMQLFTVKLSTTLCATK